jgi:predicted TIM-barrel fold metal-dependent hydrolase
MDTVVKRPQATITGTQEELLAANARSGVNRANILMHTWTNTWYDRALRASLDGGSSPGAAEEVARRAIVALIGRNNEWCAGFVKEHPQFSFFCGVHPVRMKEREMLEGLDRWTAAGAIGVKIGPQHLRIYGDDPRLLPLFDYCEQRDLPVLAQSGGMPAERGVAFGHPAPFERSLRQFPRLRLIFAHMAHSTTDPNEGAEAIAHLTAVYPHVATDLSLEITSVAEGHKTPEALMRNIRRVGIGHVLYGSNFPLADPAGAAEAFRKLPLRSDEAERIASGNFRELTAGRLGVAAQPAAAGWRASPSLR